MSLLNIFKSSKSLPEQSQSTSVESDYYVLTIQYYGKDLPIFNEQEMEPYDNISCQLSDLEDTYLSGYRSEILERSSYFEYVIKNEDTIYGLELQFKITQSRILEINQLSQDGNIYPGMVIKLPIELKNVLDQGQEQEEDIIPLTKLRKRGSSFIGVNLMNEIAQEDSTIKCIRFLSQKVTVQYITDKGSIQGVLTINQDMLFFDPTINDESQATNMKYKASINLRDVNCVNVVKLPKCMNQQGVKQCKEQILQIMLSGIGKKLFQEKYRNKLEKMKSKQESLASIYLRSVEDNVELQSKSVQRMADIINSLIQQNGDKEQTDDQRIELSTSIPYFSLLIDQSDELNLRNQIDSTNQIWGRSIKPKLKDESQIMDEDKFLSIVFNTPSIFNICDWTLLFSSLRDGSSLQTLLRQVHDRSPLILIIKDLDGYVFGAYISEPLKIKNKFYGSGETFLYTFEDKDELKVFNWAETNSEFILCDSDGIAIGCGDKYGLYINKDLSEGYSCFCSTFMNDPLSKQEVFQIDVLEVWAMDVN